VTHANGTARHAKDRPSGLGERVFTSGMVARLCGVSPRTVTKWIDSGRLPGYRIPDCEDRRVRRAELAAFMAEHGFPLPPGFGPRVLVVGEVEMVDSRRVTNVFDAGKAFAELEPSTVVVEVAAVGEGAALGMAKLLRAMARPPVVVVHTTEDQPAGTAFVKLGCRVVPPGGEG
jgi:excisionase family DNA binding protein